jgi:hypothetical protein
LTEGSASCIISILIFNGTISKEEVLLMWAPYSGWFKDRPEDVNDENNEEE